MDGKKKRGGGREGGRRRERPSDVLDGGEVKLQEGDCVSKHARVGTYTQYLVDRVS